MPASSYTYEYSYSSRTSASSNSPEAAPVVDVPKEPTRVSFSTPVETYPEFITRTQVRLDSMLQDIEKKKQALIDKAVARSMAQDVEAAAIQLSQLDSCLSKHSTQNTLPSGQEPRAKLHRHRRRTRDDKHTERPRGRSAHGREHRRESNEHPRSRSRPSAQARPRTSRKSRPRTSRPSAQARPRTSRTSRSRPSAQARPRTSRSSPSSWQPPCGDKSGGKVDKQDKGKAKGGQEESDSEADWAQLWHASRKAHQDQEHQGHQEYRIGHPSSSSHQHRSRSRPLRHQKRSMSRSKSNRSRNSWNSNSSHGSTATWGNQTWQAWNEVHHCKMRDKQAIKPGAAERLKSTHESRDVDVQPDPSSRVAPEPLVEPGHGLQDPPPSEDSSTKQRQGQAPRV